MCFGSGQSRNTAPIGKGLSPFQKRTAAELFENITPLTYEGYKYNSLSYDLLNKCHSTKGIGFLASSGARFPKKSTFRTPSPSKYFPESDKKKIKESKAVFGTKEPRKFSYDSISPGYNLYFFLVIKYRVALYLWCSVDKPYCTYIYNKKCFFFRPARSVVVKRCRKTRVAHNFGFPSVIQTVPILCMPSATDVCKKCGKLCTGDYWKCEENYLCHECWFESTVFKDKYTKDLKKYKVHECIWFGVYQNHI